MGGIRSLATAYQTNLSVTLKTTATASTYQIPIATSQDWSQTQDSLEMKNLFLFF